ncbi:MAG: hypothetical protein RLZZ628_2575 [Bacteroidota bacterium]|jgi:hypothetical protein
MEANQNLPKKALAILLTCALGWACAYLATIVYRDYAFGLFIWLPLVMGITSTVLYGYKNPTDKKELRLISHVSLFIFCVGLLLIAWEGVICVLMAAPIGLFFNWIGYQIGLMFLKQGTVKEPPVLMLLAMLSVPMLMAFENKIKVKDAPRSVITRVEIRATPEKVWKNVVEFPQLDEPTELMFKMGIAYPINAKIEGQGVGAIRHCNFSTGSFVEPITKWAQPTLLQFDVTEQPEPMKELSFYDIHPNHLHGYWVSERGQFKLTQLPNGNTLLEGTTWYRNKIKPDMYWTLWSDFIVHTIHERVLNHIKKEAER